MQPVLRAAAVLAVCAVCTAVPTRLASRKRVSKVFGIQDRSSDDYAFLMERMTISGVEVGDDQQAVGSAQEAAAEAAGAADPNDAVTKTLHFEGGTVVSVYAPHELSRMRMKMIADHVANITASEPCHCFCRFRGASGQDETDPMGSVNCLCYAQSGGQEVNHKPAAVAVDMYGERLPEGVTLEDRLLYPVPTDVRLANDELLLSLDAGDKQSWDGVSQVWRDVSGHDLSATLKGHVVWQEDGSGSLRFGQLGDGDRAIVEGLDISPRAHEALSIELWVKLHSISNPVGYIVGNDNGHDHFDRSIALHDVRFASTNAPQGATVVFAGAPYQSSLSSPPVGRWIQVVGVWSQGGMSYVYRDTVRGDGPTMTFNKDGASSLSIGGHQFSPDMFADCSVAVVRVYGRALTEAEVQDNFSFLSPRFGV